MTFKRIYLAAMLFMLAVYEVLAQGDGTTGITRATEMITGYFDPATKLI